MSEQKINEEDREFIEFCFRSNIMVNKKEENGWKENKKQKIEENRNDKLEKKDLSIKKEQKFLVEEDEPITVYYYAVRKGRKPGVYLTWKDCKKQTYQFDRPIFRKFDSYEKAYFFAFPQKKNFDENQKDGVIWKKSALQNAIEWAQYHAIQMKQGMDQKKFKTEKEELENFKKETCLFLTNKENLEKSQLNAWIEGAITWKSASFGIYFGEKDSKNCVSLFHWKNPSIINRVRLGAIIRVISIISAWIRQTPEEKHLHPHFVFIHSSSKYLVEKVNYFLRYQKDQPKNRSRSMESSSSSSLLFEDLFKCMEQQLKTVSFQIFMVLSPKEEENIIIAKNQALTLFS